MKVKCIRGIFFREKWILTEGSYYEVRSFRNIDDKSNHEDMYYLTGNDKITNWYSKDRFITVEEERDLKIDKVLDNESIM